MGIWWECGRSRKNHQLAGSEPIGPAARRIPKMSQEISEGLTLSIVSRARGPSAAPGAVYLPLTTQSTGERTSVPLVNEHSPTGERIHTCHRSPVHCPGVLVSETAVYRHRELYVLFLSFMDQQA